MEGVYGVVLSVFNVSFVGYVSVAVIVVVI